MESEFDNALSFMPSITYNVPATPVSTCVLSDLNSFARPKSAIFGLRSSSSNILAALMSLCMMCWWQSWCIYASPLAVPMRMSSLFLQLNICREFLSSSEFKKCNIYKMRKTITECIQHKYTVFWTLELFPYWKYACPSFDLVKTHILAFSPGHPHNNHGAESDSDVEHSLWTSLQPQTGFRLDRK